MTIANELEHNITLDGFDLTLILFYLNITLILSTQSTVTALNLKLVFLKKNVQQRFTASLPYVIVAEVKSLRGEERLV